MTMAPDWNLILGFVGVGIVLVSGFVQLRVNQTKQFAALKAAIDEIKLRLDIDEKQKPERDAARRLEIADIARAEIRIHKAECPMRENTGVREMPIGGV
jgi:hypothetical protein